LVDAPAEFGPRQPENDGGAAEGSGSATTLPLEVFTQRKFVAEFIRFKLIFIHKNNKFTF